MAGVRTRHKSESSLASYLGAASDLLPGELSTLRACLRQALQFQEDNISRGKSVAKVSYPISQITKDVADAVYALWLKANMDFQTPVVCSVKSLQRTLEKAWNTAQDIVRNRVTKKREVTKEEQIDRFNARLDKLLDKSKCRCCIQLCSTQPPCMNTKTGKKCTQGAHISCSCKKEEKLPVLDLHFLYLQREKIGDKGQIRMSDNPDMVEQTKENRRKARADLEDQRKVRKDTKLNAEEQDYLERSQEEENLNEEVESEPTNISNEKEETNTLEKRNTMDISGLAQTALRYELSNREAGACATSFLGDLIRAGRNPAPAPAPAPAPFRLPVP